MRHHPDCECPKCWPPKPYPAPKKRKAPIVHLLRPKLYRTWCLPRKVPADLQTTVEPSKCTCCNCLTLYRRRDGTMGKGKGRFHPAHTGRDLEQYDGDGDHY